MQRVLIPFLVLSLSLPVSAQDSGYKIVRPDGTVEFTDRPAAGAKEITLPKAQSYTAPTYRTQEAPVAEKAQAEPAVGYQRVAITSPTSEETLRDTGGVVSVSVETKPAVSREHVVVILLDGKEAVRGNSSPLILNDVERGSHTLVAEVRDAKDAVLQQSAKVTFYMFQHSILHKPAR